MVLAGIMEQRVAKAARQLESRSGEGAELLASAVGRSLEAQGRALADKPGKRERGAGKKELCRLVSTVALEGDQSVPLLAELRAAIEEEEAAVAAQDEADQTTDAGAAACLVNGDRPPSDGPIAGGDTGGDGDSDDDSENGEDSAEGPAAAPVAGDWWQWRAPVCEYLEKVRGLARVRRERPSTSAFGNWALSAGLRALYEASTDYVDPHAVLGAPEVSYVLSRRVKGRKIRAMVAAGDDADKIASQWSALRDAFSKPRSALVFHLSNHYALIAALREWIPQGSEGAPRRQLLTARKGQRPTVWVDFDEVRQLLLKWSGHAIMAVHRPRAQPLGC